ncbi:MAG: DUF459 domain-containing protein [Xanthobacteraceae bacterium]|nr:DUF459 domain-containing protein [Xanthobacteraceae bacterium]
MKRWLHRIRRESGTLLACAAACGLIVSITAPASAQFFDFGFGRPSQPPRAVQRNRGGLLPSFGDGLFGGGEQRQAPPPRPESYAKPPAPAQRETPAEQNVLVIGDAMADWLAYGLEDALSETPELGVVRKAKTYSGLIRYQPKGDPVDWAAAAKGILATENPDVIVVMLGLSDRIQIREAEKKVESKTDKDAKSKKDSKADSKPKTDTAADKPDDEKAASDPANKADADATPDDEDPSAPEKTTRSANGITDFRDDRWVELYTRKIEEMVSILKSKGVPVLWVGLPAVRGTKSTSDMLFLDSLYRDVAGKMGITYVDVWDGFVDDSGRFMTSGPDFEGQIRKLRSPDGVYFTKAGARKIAHYTEREIRRVLAARSGPIALPTDQSVPDSNVAVKPGEPPPRPLAGPVVPLVASSAGSTELLGGGGSRPASVDALASRTLVKGEPLSVPAGRADDFSWPPRQIGELNAPATSDVATASPSTDGTQKPAAAPKPKRPAQAAASSQGFFDPNRSLPPRPRGYVRPDASSSGFFFFR